MSLVAGIFLIVFGAVLIAWPEEFIRYRRGRLWGGREVTGADRTTHRAAGVLLIAFGALFVAGPWSEG
jgi:drug/metabolite transporter (DMT)-like permease